MLLLHSLLQRLQLLLLLLRPRLQLQPLLLLMRLLLLLLLLLRPRLLQPPAARPQVASSATGRPWQAVPQAGLATAPAILRAWRVLSR